MANMAASFTWLALLLCSGLAMVMSVCPSGWVKYEDECLYFSYSSMGWHEAENDCRNRSTNSYLVTDDTQKKHYSINMHIIIRGGWHYPTTFWTGANDFMIENQWRWVKTGASIGSTSYWDQGQPNGNRTANCVAFHLKTNSELVWRDEQCSNKYNYICEQK